MGLPQSSEAGVPLYSTQMAKVSLWGGLVQVAGQQSWLQLLRLRRECADISWNLSFHVLPLNYIFCPILNRGKPDYHLPKVFVLLAKASLHLILLTYQQVIRPNLSTSFQLHCFHPSKAILTCHNCKTHPNDLTTFLQINHFHIAAKEGSLNANLIMSLLALKYKI